MAELERCAIYPATHFVTDRGNLERAIGLIREELAQRLAALKEAGKLLEAQRLESRTRFDIEMMLEVGTCHGIENYSRHISGRASGERPACLMDFFPKDFLVIVDESHVTVPQIGAMYAGDRSRKETLVEYGFRLPSALDNRPLRYDEFLALAPRVLFLSATPGPEELRLSGGSVVEQLVRPTGLVDPEVEIRKVAGQVDDLLTEIRVRERRGERVLVTTLTKRMAEDLTDYLSQVGVRVRYMHSDIDAIERMDIIRGLRLGEFDVLVGINLLREGLDLPEVSLVAILDADQEGFLRSRTSLIQTCGRAARHLAGRAIMYADRITDSMKAALEEMDRRRVTQLRYNQEHGITPRSIVKSVDEIRFTTRVADAREDPVARAPRRCRSPARRPRTGPGWTRPSAPRCSPRSRTRCGARRTTSTSSSRRRSATRSWTSRPADRRTGAQTHSRPERTDAPGSAGTGTQAWAAGASMRRRWPVRRRSSPARSAPRRRRHRGELGAGKTTLVRADRPRPRRHRAGHQPDVRPGPPLRGHGHDGLSRGRLPAAAPGRGRRPGPGRHGGRPRRRADRVAGTAGGRAASGGRPHPDGVHGRSALQECGGHECRVARSRGGHA